MMEIVIGGIRGGGGSSRGHVEVSGHKFKESKGFLSRGLNWTIQSLHGFIYLLKFNIFQGCRSLPETLYHRDDALLYIAYVILIWAAPIPADRWHCSLWP